MSLALHRDFTGTATAPITLEDVAGVILDRARLRRSDGAIGVQQRQLLDALCRAFGIE